MLNEQYSNYRSLVKNKVAWILLCCAVVVCLSTGATLFLFGQNRQLLNQANKAPITAKNQETSSEQYTRTLLEQEWVSPSGQKKIWYEKSYDMRGYQLVMFNGIRDTNIGRQNEPLEPLKVTWSPDESFVTLANPGDINRLVCTDAEQYHCTGKTLFVTYGGLFLIHWADEQTAIIRYSNLQFDVISKLVFDNSRITEFYPTETILYQEPKSAYFSYAPVSLSPNQRYIVLTFAYEGLPSLHVLDTRTKKIYNVEKNGLHYFSNEKAEYRWEGDVLYFTAGAVPFYQSWTELLDAEGNFDESKIETHSIDVNELKIEF